MREYETTFIVQPEISDDGVQTLCDRLDAVLSRSEATRLMVDDLGRRRLAYEIQNFQKGRYQLERTLRLEDSVLRYLTIQVADQVVDIEARKAEAAELERVRAEKAAERAAREAEEASRAAAEEAERAAADEEEAEEAGDVGSPSSEEVAEESDDDDEELSDSSDDEEKS
jgi:small subunit ribosomal protein S6